jgi:fructose/tagatose bisphosphate aldolase
MDTGHSLVKEPIQYDETDVLVRGAVFGATQRIRDDSRRAIRELALSRGIFPASIQELYEAASKGAYTGITVPASNIRGITYDVARAAFRAAVRDDVGAFMFEIARSEIGYTAQRPAEYVACILAAAVKEGFTGPVFILGDHFQVNRSLYDSDPEGEMNTIKELIREAVDAGFYNIDIDASTLVDLDRATIEEQQERNGLVTAELTKLIRSIEPEGTTICVGGEIGEIGKGNSTVADLRAFMTVYRKHLGPDIAGIAKISVQTGTTHGGVVLPDGSMARVSIAFDTLRELSKMAREEYGMGGAVQHGASTLPDDAFSMFPQAGTVEVHLATGYQNIIYDCPYFPKDLLDEIYVHLADKYSSERKPGESEHQFLYKTRKKAFGDFKEEMWLLPEEILNGIRDMLEDRFTLLFHSLNVVNTTELVARFVTNLSLLS